MTAPSGNKWDVSFNEELSGPHGRFKFLKPCYNNCECMFVSQEAMATAALKKHNKAQATSRMARKNTSA